ncbi:MAG: tRNA pseudouridine(13) synthase TruD [Caldilineaceae bacterium]|nr:tRNA pseudouridine(13) synthase TruD [Caldilineaceae bacterium]
MQENNALDRELKLSLPYISADLPGVGGQLRASPDHFVVEEVPLYEPIGEGQHLYVNLTKQEMTTRDVQKKLASIFNLPNGEVGFAGMKDKYARTTQTFSLNVGHVDSAFVDAAAVRIEEALPVTVHWVNLHRNKLKAGHLLGNRFSIRVTEMDLPVDEAFQRAQTIVAQIQARGLPNFYGPQRLGQQGSNVLRGFELIVGQRKMKDRWLRDLLRASVQSYMCNRYLAERVERGLFDQVILGDVAKKYDTGGLFEVTDVDAEQPRYERKEISFTAPIYGPKMWITTGDAGALEEAVLAESGVTLDDLHKAHLTGTRRMGRLIFADLQVQPHETGLNVRFFLPKGAFATTVLREIMKVDDNALASIPADDSD